MNAQRNRIILALAVCLGLFLVPAWADKGGNKDKNKDKGHSANDSGRPPGWDKGKKTGWGDCDVPPGQAKKQGCNGYSAKDDKHGRDHDRGRDQGRKDVSQAHDRDRNRTQRTTQSSALPNPKIVVKSPNAPASSTTATRSTRPTRDAQSATTAKTTAKTPPKATTSNKTDTRVRPNRD